MNPSDTPQFTDVQRAKLEGHLLRVALAQAHATIADLQAKLASHELTAERAELEAEVVTDPSYRIDWHKLELVKEEKEPPK